MSSFDQDQDPTGPEGSKEPGHKPSKVGYRQPPVHTRFPRGHSGNPGGRPRGPSTERASRLIIEEAYRLIKVREGDEVKKMSALRAIVRSQLKAALKGNGRVQREIIAMVQASEEALTKAAAAAKAAAPEDTREVSDMDLARWILSVLENAAEAQDEAAIAALAKLQTTPKQLPPPTANDKPNSES